MKPDTWDPQVVEAGCTVVFDGKCHWRRWSIQRILHIEMKSICGNVTTKEHSTVLKWQELTWGQTVSVEDESQPICICFNELHASSSYKNRARNQETCRRSVNWIQYSTSGKEYEQQESQSTSSPIGLSILKPGWIYGNDRIWSSLIGLTLHLLLDPNGKNKVDFRIVIVCSLLEIWVLLV